MIRAVLDTNVLVSALLHLEGSPSSQIFELFLRKEFLLLTSKPILMEVERLIDEDRIVTRYLLSEKRRRAFIASVHRLSRPVPTRMSISNVVEDSDDNKFLACAMKGKADFVVSGDRHLLDLDHFHKIKIVTPKTFLALLQQPS
jgi:uncharacterized protein